MAAGLGFKTFANGEVLSAADVNGYLMQGILVFADAAARSAAITSPQEGQASYLKDTDVIQVYSGSAWVTKSGASPLTTKGDLYTYSTTDARLGVGANDTVLTADSTAATGLKWATAASGGMTLLSTTTLSGATVNINSISQSYKDLKIVIDNVTLVADATPILVFRNGTTDLTCRYQGIAEGTSQGIYGASTEIYLNPAVTGYNNTGGLNSYQLTLTNYTSTTSYARPFISSAVFNTAAGASGASSSGMQYGAITDTGAVNSLQFYLTTSTYNGGTVKIWGIS